MTSSDGASWLWWSLVLGLLAAALGLWFVWLQRRAAQRTERVLAQHLPGVFTADETEEDEPLNWNARVESLMRRADLNLTRRAATFAVLAVALVGLLLEVLLGWQAVLGWLALVSLAALVGLQWRLDWVNRQMTLTLPHFIDALVRSLAVGNSVAAGFVASAPSASGPLKPCLAHASSLIQAGLDIDTALKQTARFYRLDALRLLASVMRLSVQYGGQVDQVLERIAAFMRDRQEAQQELIALSSETRLSALVIGLLPVGVALALSVVNPAYMATLWTDPGGRKLLWIALGLQTVGSVLLVRMTRLRE